MEFEQECIQCKNINTNSNGVVCAHTKDEHHLTHVFTLIEADQIIDFEGKVYSWDESFDSICCRVEVKLIDEIINNEPIVTKYRILCTHPIGEDHAVHIFDVVDLKDYDWKNCACDSSSDSSSSHDYVSD